MRGRKPNAAQRTDRTMPTPPDALPRCPAHLSAAARNEWRRLAKPLYDMGVISTTDRGALAAYCQAWGRWVEAEEQLKKTPPLLKSPSGYVQQSPWLAVANKQLEIMGRFMAELGLTPSARSRVALARPEASQDRVTFKVVYEWKDGTERDRDGNIVEDGPGKVMKTLPCVDKL